MNHTNNIFEISTLEPIQRGSNTSTPSRHSSPISFGILNSERSKILNF